METPMEMDLRQAIEQRVAGKSETELREIIDGSVGQEEMTLPGLGVLFEMIWTISPADDKSRMTGLLHRSLNGQA